VLFSSPVNPTDILKVLGGIGFFGSPKHSTGVQTSQFAFFRMTNTRGSLVSFFKPSPFVGFAILEATNIDCDAACRTNSFPYYYSHSHLLRRGLFAVVISDDMNSTEKSATCII